MTFNKLIKNNNSDNDDLELGLVSCRSQFGPTAQSTTNPPASESSYLQVNHGSDDVLCSAAAIVQSDLTAQTIKKTVRFATTVTVRILPITLGDHPCCKDGLALTCDWANDPPTKQHNFEEFEMASQKRRHQDLCLDYSQRRQRLLEVTGLTGFELLQQELALQQQHIEEDKQMAVRQSIRRQELLSSFKLAEDDDNGGDHGVLEQAEQRSVLFKTADNPLGGNPSAEDGGNDDGFLDYMQAQQRRKACRKFSFMLVILVALSAVGVRLAACRSNTGSKNSVTVPEDGLAGTDSDAPTLFFENVPAKEIFHHKPTTPPQMHLEFDDAFADAANACLVSSCFTIKPLVASKNDYSLQQQATSVLALRSRPVFATVVLQQSPMLPFASVLLVKVTKMPLVASASFPQPRRFVAVSSFRSSTVRKNISVFPKPPCFIAASSVSTVPISSRLQQVQDNMINAANAAGGLENLPDTAASGTASSLVAPSFFISASEAKKLSTIAESSQVISFPKPPLFARASGIISLQFAGLVTSTAFPPTPRFAADFSVQLSTASNNVSVFPEPPCFIAASDVSEGGPAPYNSSRVQLVQNMINAANATVGDLPDAVRLSGTTSSRVMIQPLVTSKNAPQQVPLLPFANYFLAFLANNAADGRATVRTVSSCSVTSSPFGLQNSIYGGGTESSSLMLSISCSLSATGAINNNNGARGGRNHNNDSWFGNTSDLGLVQSQSAAPSVSYSGDIVPPPGFGGGVNNNSSALFSNIGGIRCPQNMGAIGTTHTKPHALKPPAKTLMDFIQKDFPGEASAPPHASSGMDASEWHSVSTGDCRSTSPEKQDFGHGVSPPGYRYSSVINTVVSSNQHNQLQQQQHSFMMPSPSNSVASQQQFLQQQYMHQQQSTAQQQMHAPPHQQQQYLPQTPQQQEILDDRYGDRTHRQQQQAPLVHGPGGQQQQQVMTRQGPCYVTMTADGHMVNQQQPQGLYPGEDPKQRLMYAQVTPQQQPQQQVLYHPEMVSTPRQQTMHAQLDPQTQQIYYPTSLITATLGQQQQKPRVGMQLQAQVLPNGQTVHVQTLPPSQLAPPYGYTIQHQQHQAPRIIHHPSLASPQARTEQQQQQQKCNISVIPMQSGPAGTQRVAYWMQDEGAGQTILMGPTRNVAEDAQQHFDTLWEQRLFALICWKLSQHPPGRLAMTDDALEAWCTMQHQAKRQGLLSECCVQHLSLTGVDFDATTTALFILPQHAVVTTAITLSAFATESSFITAFATSPAPAFATSATFATLCRCPSRFCSSATYQSFVKGGTRGTTAATTTTATAAAESAAKYNQRQYQRRKQLWLRQGWPQQSRLHQGWSQWKQHHRRYYQCRQQQRRKKKRQWRHQLMTILWHSLNRRSDGGGKVLGHTLNVIRGSGTDLKCINVPPSHGNGSVRLIVHHSFFGPGP